MAPLQTIAIDSETPVKATNWTVPKAFCSDGNLKAPLKKKQRMRSYIYLEVKDCIFV
jgi:hypothetical protein